MQVCVWLEIWEHLYFTKYIYVQNDIQIVEKEQQTLLNLRATEWKSKASL